MHELRVINMRPIPIDESIRRYDDRLEVKHGVCVNWVVQRKKPVHTISTQEMPKSQSSNK